MIHPGTFVDNWQSWHPKTQMKEESKTMYFMDTRIGSDTQAQDGLINGTTRLRFRHGNTTLNALFIDGHVQSMNLRTIPNKLIFGRDVPESYFWRRAIVAGGIWYDY